MADKNAEDVVAGQEAWVLHRRALKREPPRARRALVHGGVVQEETCDLVPSPVVPVKGVKPVCVFKLHNDDLAASTCSGAPR